MPPGVFKLSMGLFTRVTRQWVSEGVFTDPDRTPSKIIFWSHVHPDQPVYLFNTQVQTYIYVKHLHEVGHMYIYIYLNKYIYIYIPYSMGSQVKLF